MADIQIPQLATMLATQRDLSDLYMVRDITDGFDRQTTHENVLNPFKVAANYDFATSTTISVGDFGVGGKLVNLSSLPQEYIDIGMSGDMADLETGFFQGTGGVTGNAPVKIAASAPYGVINLEASNPNNTSQVSFGLQTASGIADYTPYGAVRVGQVTDKRMFVKSSGDAKGEMSVAYAEETYTRKEVTNILDDLMQNKIYPIGSMYFNAGTGEDSLANPASILGFGTWTAIEGQVLMGSGVIGTVGQVVGIGNGGGGADNYSRDYTFNLDMNLGSLSVDNHTLTEGEMPSHNHASGGLATASAGNHNHNLVPNTTTDRLFATRFNVGAVNGLQARFDIDGDENSDAFMGFGRDSDVNTIVNLTQSQSNGSHTHSITGSTSTVGSDEGHDHSLSGTQTGSVSLNSISTLQPSFVTKIWRRTA